MWVHKNMDTRMRGLRLQADMNVTTCHNKGKVGNLVEKYTLYTKNMFEICRRE